MKTIIQISLLIVFVLSACSTGEPDRKELIEQQLCIALPSSYETLINEYQTLEVIPSEYQIKVQFRFNQNGYREIEDQIIEVPYYNSLQKYINSGNGIVLMGQEEIDDYQNIKDSLAQRDYRGSWIKIPDGYTYVDILGPDNGEPVEAMLNTKNKTLTFKYMNI